MPTWNLQRREFVRSMAAAVGASALGAPRNVAQAASPPNRLATFRAAVTPPIGSPLSGGWIQPAIAVTDPLYALGIVLLGDDAPIVLCAVDWCEMRCEDHLLWRSKLAAAAGTSSDRVAVQCLHQHNAPISDLAAQRLVQGQPRLSNLMDVEWFHATTDRVAAAVRAAVQTAAPVTHVALGEAKVEQVASNRRVMGPDGKVKAVRYSATKDAALREAPEGLIDPILKTISFLNGEKKQAVLHYYATHPMSFYGDGLITSDFAGLARERRTIEDEVPHIYFTGCGGNITAGKYNDGSIEARRALTERIHKGMVDSEQRATRMPVGRITWRAEPILLPPHRDLVEADLLKMIADPALPGVRRKAAALKVTFLRQIAAKEPIVLSALHLGGKLCILHLPGEPFIEYQLFAQQQWPEGFVAVAGYGDAGPGYIPLAKSFDEGGYEPTWAFASPETETLLKAAVTRLVKP